MKSLSPGFQSHLDSGATTLCLCWKLALADGRIFGFTDHDLPLTFDGTSFEPTTGFTATAVETQLGLNIDNLDVLGALQSTALTEDDLSSGKVDNADIEIYRVNWAVVAERILIKKGSLGEISRTETAFVAEVRGLAHFLNQTTGRLYQKTCDIDLGSPKCSIDLTSQTYKGTGTVLDLSDNRQFTASGLTAYQSDWFASGKIRWLTGNNAGLVMEVKEYGLNGATATIELWQSMDLDVAITDTFNITAGCDKTKETCKSKFNNLLNFRGMPHMPGNDFVLSYPNRGSTNDGGSLVRNN